VPSTCQPPGCPSANKLGLEQHTARGADAQQLPPLPLLQALAYWTNGTLAKAFSTWCGWAQHSAHKRAGLQRSLGHWTNGTLAKAFSTWCGWAQHSAHKRAGLQRSLGHWANGTLARAFSTWIGWVGEQRELAGKMERVRRRELQARSCTSAPTAGGRTGPAAAGNAASSAASAAGSGVPLRQRRADRAAGC
jgi:hypothetical protein